MLPTVFLSRIKSFLWDDYNNVIDAFSTNRKGSFRINFLKSNVADVLEEFAWKWIEVERFDSIAGVYIFDKIHEYAIKGTRAFYDGKIYLQSIASLIPALAMAPEKDMHILDVCAAPGSKTTQIAMMMKNQGHITAIEQNQIRYDKLMYNVGLQGVNIVEWVKMEAKKLLLSLDQNVVFDAILLDAPCSAEGRISLENEKSYGFWSLENIAKKSEIQSELLSLAFAHLKVGGIIVYATCTLAPEENEAVVAKLLSTHKSAEIIPINIGLSGAAWWKNDLLSLMELNIILSWIMLCVFFQVKKQNDSLWQKFVKINFNLEDTDSFLQHRDSVT